MKLSVNILTAVLVFLSGLLTPVMAAGGSPYGPFEPEDTGVVLDSFLLIGIILYALGMLFVVYSRILKNKLEQ